MPASSTHLNFLGHLFPELWTNGQESDCRSKTQICDCGSITKDKLCSLQKGTGKDGEELVLHGLEIFLGLVVGLGKAKHNISNRRKILVPRSLAPVHGHVNLGSHHWIVGIVCFPLVARGRGKVPEQGGGFPQGGTIFQFQGWAAVTGVHR
jgi:hypothetical protein